jgi:IclR family KDG regulon transcriptional repressor
MPTATYNNSIEKGLQLLTLFTGDRPAQRLAEISREAGMPKATALRFLNALTRQGFLRKDAAGAYRLGYRLIELGHRASDQLDLRTIALPYMGALRDALDEAVQIAVIDGTEAVYLEKLECRQPVRLFTKAGRRAPLHAGACPRLLLSFAPDLLTNLVLSERAERRQFTETTPTDPKQLRALIEQTRRDGYSLSFGELEAGSAALAVPLRDYSGNVVATLSVAGPAGRFGPDRVPEILANARDTAAQISREFGFVPATRS